MSDVTLKYLLLGEDKSASSSMKKLGGETEAAGGKFHKFSGAAKLAMVGSGAAVVGFLKDSVQGWADHEKVLRQAQQVIKSTGGVAGITAKQMDDLSGSIESNTGVDGDNVLQGENMLATFTNIHNQQGKGNDIFNQATSIMTDMSVAMGTDMKGQAIQLGKALNDPIHGVGALSKVGVTFTEQQKKQIATMVKAGDTAGAQRVILHELSKEFGGSAKAQETSGQKMAVAFHNLQDTIGKALLPIVTKLANFITNTVIPIFQKVSDFVVKHKTLFMILAATIGTLVVGLKLWAIAQGILNAVMALNPIALVVIAVAALAAGLIYAYKHSEKFRNIVKDAFTVVKTIVSAVWNYYLKPIFLAWKLYVTAIGTAALWLWHNAIQPAWAAIKAIISGAWNNVIKPVASAIGTAFHAIGTALRWVWDNIISPIFGGIKSGIRGVRDVVHAVAKGFTAVLKPIVTAFQWIARVVGRLVGGIIHTVNSMIDAVSQGVGAVQSLLGMGGTATMGPGGAHAGSAASGSLGGGTTGRARAGGGRVFAGMPYLVGEERPELFVPDSNGSIRPRVGGSSGGGNVYITFPAGVILGSPAEVGRAVGKAMEYAGNAGVKFHIRKAVV